MCETHEIRKEREAEKKGHWGSSWEYEDCRSLQKRDLTVQNGLYREDDSGSRYRAAGQNRPYRKRHCGYWDFEQSESSYLDYEEATESGKDCMYHRGGTQVCDGYRNSEDVDYGHLSSGTKANWLTGSPDVTWKAGGCRETNEYTDGKDPNYNPKDSEETERWTGDRSLDDSLGNFGQPQNWHVDHRNFNYNLEDCKETNINYRDLNNLYHVPVNYTNGQSVDFNGVSEGKEFVKYYERDSTVYQNDKVYPKARTHAMDQSNSETENKVFDILFANCEYKHQNYRETDSLHQMKNLEHNGIGKPGMTALGSRAISPNVLWDQWTRGDQEEHHCGVPQGPSLERNTWHLEEERKLNGPETWKRNSCFRRTAPSTLRRSEFVQNRKRTQGTSAAFLQL